MNEDLQQKRIKVQKELMKRYDSEDPEEQEKAFADIIAYLTPFLCHIFKNRYPKY